MVLLSLLMRQKGPNLNNTVKARRQFIDTLRVYVKGGAGGMGQPKYGGIGGQGGNVYVVAKDGKTLKDTKSMNPKRRFTAGRGNDSRKHCLVGEPGEDYELYVPPGVAVLNETGLKMGEVNKEGDRLLVARGGYGGNIKNKFNGEGINGGILRLDLKLIADIGLVGFPNAGKSTLLRAVSQAKPKVADYPFTTITPNLGVMHYKDNRQITMADLPGLIEGAHVNIGMGYRFLKHVERTKLLLFVVDIHGFQLGVNHKFRTAFDTVVLLNKELEMYKEPLLDKPAVLAINKMDTPGASEKIDGILHQIDNMENSMEHIEPDFRPTKIVKFDQIFTISAKENLSTEFLKEHLRELLDVYADKEITSSYQEEENRLVTPAYSGDVNVILNKSYTSYRIAKKYKEKSEHKLV